MTDLLIATHDQALHAIRAHIDQPGTDPLLRAVVTAVLAVHVVDPPETAGQPWSDCADCDGTGWIAHLVDEGVNRRHCHCHCQCPWCAGCDEALCTGPCPTVKAIAEALGLLASSDLPEGEDRP